MAECWNPGAGEVETAGRPQLASLAKSVSSGSVRGGVSKNKLRSYVDLWSLQVRTHAYTVTEVQRLIEGG